MLQHVLEEFKSTNSVPRGITIALAVLRMSWTWCCCSEAGLASLGVTVDAPPKQAIDNINLLGKLCAAREAAAHAAG